MKINYTKGQDINGCIYLKETNSDKIYGKNKYTIRECLFQCKCGKEFISGISSVKSGKTTSCGCAKSKPKTHGQASRTIQSSEWKTWKGIKKRCYNDKEKYYYLYGGKGITVCDRWLNSFENFFEDMGEKPSKNHSLDRINGNKGYFKENCRWATNFEQNRNKSNNQFLTFEGITKCIQDWAKEYNMNYATLLFRLKNWNDIKKSLNTPVKHYNTIKAI